jgi:hypothetical protein
MLALQAGESPRRKVSRSSRKRATEIARRNRQIGVPPADSDNRQVAHFSREVSYSGPPPASYFLEFEKIAPGEGQRELEHYRGQTSHRQQRETSAQRGENGRAWAGVGVSAVISFALLATAFHLASTGHDEVAKWIYRYSFWPFVAIFAVGSGTRAYERIRKWQLVNG